MTDKQIKIDDVDISKCEYHSKLLEGVCTFYGRCANTFCPYKANWLKEQLLSKEQECENNKILHRMDLDIYNQECLNLQEELKETLEQLEAYKMEAEEGKEINAELKAENEHLSEKEEEARHYLKEAEKFKNCLIEIKEIVEKHAPRCNDSANCNYTCEACHLSDLKQILQKINECEV